MLIKPARLQNKKPFGKKWLILGLLIILGIIIYFLFFTHNLDLRRWEITENNTIITQDDPKNSLIQSEIGKNILLIDETKIINDIHKLYPEINTIKITKILPNKIKIDLQNYEQIANIINVADGIQKKFIVNSNGFLTQENIDNPDLPYIKIKTQKFYTVRTNITQTNQLEFVINSIKQFETKFNLKITDAEFMPREREVHLRTEKNFMVWIDMEKDLNLQLEKLKKILGKLNIYNTPLEYIDLRISGTDNEKVIFKRRK